MQPIEKPDLIVLDLDGTLTHISPLAARVSSVSDKWDIPLTWAVFELMKAAQNVYQLMGIHSEFAQTVKRKILNKLSEEGKGSFELLLNATSQNIPCALLSNGPDEWGQKTIDRLALRPFFDEVRFRGQYLKPDPRCLLPILDTYADTLGEHGTVWIYGDRGTDAMLAYNTNPLTPHKIVPIAVEGMASGETIKKMKHAFNIEGHVFKSIDDIARMLDPDVERPLSEEFSKFEISDKYEVVIPELHDYKTTSIEFIVDNKPTYIEPRFQP